MVDMNWRLDVVARQFSDDRQKVIYVLCRNSVATGECNSASLTKHSFTFDFRKWNGKNLLCEGDNMTICRRA